MMIISSSTVYEVGYKTQRIKKKLKSNFFIASSKSLAYQMIALMQLEICNYPSIHQKSGD